VGRSRFSSLPFASVKMLAKKLKITDSDLRENTVIKLQSMNYSCNLYSPCKRFFPQYI
jgi:hypothetical protein